MPIKEIDLAKVVVNFLYERGWDVYQEVHASGRTCDIVAINGRFSWAIECKKAGLFKVMAQAHEWKGWASFVSVAVPWTEKSHAEHRLSHEVCQYLGIGLLAIKDDNINELFPPRPLRRLSPYFDIKAYLHEGQKTFAPAGSKSGYFSPFKQTCIELRWYVRDHPGCTMKEAMGEIGHHYTSDITARAAMLAWLHKGIVPGIQIQREGKRIFLYPVESVSGKEE